MRATVTLDDDVAAAVGRLRREHGIGLSEAVNRLARAGLPATAERAPFRQRTARLDLRVDAHNVAEAVETVDGAGER